MAAQVAEKGDTKVRSAMATVACAMQGARASAKAREEGEGGNDGRLADGLETGLPSLKGS